MRNSYSCIGGLLLLAGAQVCAASASASVAEAEGVVRETTDKVLAALREEGEGLKKDPDRLYQLVDELIVPHFDFRQMSQWVLGRHWREATPQQRDAFVEQFKGLLVRTYSRALVDYRNEKVDFLPTRERSPTEVTVRAEIDQGGGPRIPVTYEMHHTGAGWKVYDVAVEGVSLVINYRSSFGQEIRRTGIDGLIRRLQEKNGAGSG